MLNRLQSLLIVTSILSLLPASVVRASSLQADILSTEIEGNTPATVVDEWMAQVEASIIQITEVQVEATDAGLSVVLEIANGELIRPTTEIVDNALIVTIPNAMLALSDEEMFEQFAPSENIALVSVVNVPGNQVQMTITGTTAPPDVDVASTITGLALSVTPGVAQVGAADDTIQVVVTGAQDEGYNPSRSSTATGTDTPLRDVPFSIQVIPREVLDDRNVTELGNALETAGGVISEGLRGTGSLGPEFLIRGFDSTIFQNGIRAFTITPLSTNNVERVEVLRGPASILFGQGDPGGIINLVTKQPLSEPFYEISATAGNFDTYRGAVDLSGPLGETENVRYRFNLSYENFGSFRDFVDGERFQISPTIAWDLGPNTSLDLYGQYTYDRETVDEGIPFDSNGNPIDVPRSRFLNEDFGETTQDQFSLGYRLNHDFSDSWSISHNSEYLQYETVRFHPFIAFGSFDDVTGELTRNEQLADDIFRRFFTNAEIRRRFDTGPVQHQLLFGVEYRHDDQEQNFSSFAPFAPINVFNPIYADEPFERNPTFFRDDNIDTIGVYLQDQIDITSDLILLAGVRFDYVDQFRTEQNEGEPRQQFELSDEKFSPRVGIVYQPVEPLSLYASYTTSFLQAFAGFRNPDGSTFEPEEGRQFEVGLKADLSNRLSLNLAAFDIRRQNVATRDRDDPFFFVQTGEVTSRGVELIVNGEILPGWDVTTAYTYLDAFVSEDNTGIEGNRPENVPENQFSLWTTYEIQQGNLEGLGFGLGLLFVGERAGDPENTFTLPDYFRTDAALFYRRDNWRLQLNLENLFDIEYFTSVNYGSRLSVNPGAPFGVLGSFAIEF